MKLTLDYMIPMTIQIDTETGEIASEAWVHVADSLASYPDQIFNRDILDNDSPEYLPDDHPEHKRAIEMLDRIEIGRSDDIRLPLRVEPARKETVA